MGFLAERQIANPIVLSGDIHAFVVSGPHRVSADLASAVVASEFVVTSLSSDSPPEQYFETSRRLDPNLVLATGLSRGYIPNGHRARSAARGPDCDANRKAAERSMPDAAVIRRRVRQACADGCLTPMPVGTCAPVSVVTAQERRAERQPLPESVTLGAPTSAKVADHRRAGSSCQQAGCKSIRRGQPMSSACPAASEQIHDRKQDDRAQQ